MPDSPAHRMLNDALKRKPEAVDEAPADAFDRYLAEVEPNLPDRYHHPGRRVAHPYYGSPAIGLAIVFVGLVVSAVARWIGWL